MAGYSPQSSARAPRTPDRSSSTFSGTMAGTGGRPETPGTSLEACLTAAGFPVTDCLSNASKHTAKSAESKGERSVVGQEAEAQRKEGQSR